MAKQQQEQQEKINQGGKEGQEEEAGRLLSDTVGSEGGVGWKEVERGGKRLGSERSGGIELALAAVKVGSVASLEEEKEQKRTEKASIVSSYLSKDQGSLFLFVSRRMVGETERERECTTESRQRVSRFN